VPKQEELVVWLGRLVVPVPVGADPAVLNPASGHRVPQPEQKQGLAA
jgi:hypothetical protein